MSVTWDEATFANFYSGKIGWADPTDPGNTNGERIGQSYGYGLDFARYAERNSGPYIPYYFWVKRAAWLLNKLILAGFLPTHRLLVVASGFGYLPYIFRHASAIPGIADDYPNCWGIELPGSWIEANYAAQRLEDVNAFADWSKAVQARNALDAKTGDHTFHIIINWYTESFRVRDPLTGLVVNSERNAFNSWLDLCEAALIGTNTSHIIHMIDNALLPGELATDTRYQVQRDAGCAIGTLAEWASIRPAHTWLDTRTGDFILGSGF